MSTDSSPKFLKKEKVTAVPKGCQYNIDSI